METNEQESLNTLVREKLQKKIERSQPKAKDAVAKLIEEGKISRDFVAPLGVKLRNREEQPVITFQKVTSPEQVTRILMHLAIIQGTQHFSMHQHAVGQIGKTKW